MGTWGDDDGHSHSHSQAATAGNDDHDHHHGAVEDVHLGEEDQQVKRHLGHDYGHSTKGNTSETEANMRFG